MARPLVTIALPVYNAAPYLRECVDSVLAQDYVEFELLAADDGSTDESLAILRSYADRRLRVLACAHDYIATLNRLLDEASGCYVARMDADDVMLPGRLSRQVAYLEEHPEVDVLGGGMEMFGQMAGTSIMPELVTLPDMLEGCCMAHPTVMMRRSFVERHALRYEPAFVYAEDYRLWLRMLQAGGVFRNLPEPLIRYRLSAGQVTRQKAAVQAAHAAEARKQALVRQEQVEAEVRADIPSLPASANALTVVVPFLNEGEELAATLRSVKETAGEEVDIVVVDDCSDDGYDYAADLRGMRLTYVRNCCRIGAAASKEKGVQMTATPYFLLLDAHMRFYCDNWHRRIVDALRADERQLLCCQTRVLKKENGLVSQGEESDVCGAFAVFDRHEYLPGIRWNRWRANHMLRDDEVPCVLGAGYAASKAYWNRLHGLRALRHYGCEETYVSIKAWLEGGRCRLLPDVVVGHIYRAHAPYTIATSAMRYNYFVNSEVLFPSSLRCWAHAVGCQLDRNVYARVRERIDVHREELERERRYVAALAQRDFSFVLAVNDIISPEKADAAHAHEQRLPQLLDFVCAGPDGAQNVGLWDGMAGQLLAAALYAETSGLDRWADCAGRLLDQVCAAVRGEQPVSLARGLCGVGWTLLFLKSRGLVGDDVAADLDEIDRRVQERSPRRTADVTLLSGLGGVLCYVVSRLGQLRREGQTMGCFAPDYLDELDEAARRVLKESDDYRCHSFALQWLARHEADWTILPPMLDDVVDLPAFLPEDARFWQPGLEAATGYAVHLMASMQNIRERQYKA